MSVTTPDTTPTTVADLLGLQLAHRMMRRDARRLAELSARWAAGKETMDRRRGRDLVWWTDNLCREIHHHHTAEDEILWPVLERWAGEAVDLGELSDEHAALDPMLEGLKAATRVACSGGDRERADLAERWATLADLLDEHIAEEERDLLPIITGYVPLDTWHEVEEGVRRRDPNLRFILPRMRAVVTDEEFATLRDDAGPVLMILLRLVRPGVARRERRLWPSTAATRHLLDQAR